MSIIQKWISESLNQMYRWLPWAHRAYLGGIFPGSNPLKRIHSCYKSLKCIENVPEINVNSFRHRSLPNFIFWFHPWWLGLLPWSLNDFVFSALTPNCRHTIIFLLQNTPSLCSITADTFHDLLCLLFFCLHSSINLLSVTFSFGLLVAIML